ncbi:hypothetical protein [Holdemania sp. 1001302B_160321_E10]|uniref:hypothetical protein n=1 Tax=Holdemania sp. 1001302B_160321_E10 TaxID=2787120 RepID=UPI0018977F18|nr:hypothetical protein [Holdemania sp. 1001302B_160321_E10]
MLEDHEKLRFPKVCGSQSRNTAGMENEADAAFGKKQDFQGGSSNREDERLKVIAKMAKLLEEGCIFPLFELQ